MGFSPCDHFRWYRRLFQQPSKPLSVEIRGGCPLKLVLLEWVFLATSHQLLTTQFNVPRDTGVPSKS
jgi:hypothetical protein